MNRILIGVIIAVMLAWAATGYVAKSRHDTAKALETQVSTLRKAHNRALARAAKDRKALVASEAEKGAMRLKSNEAQQGLSQALQGEKAWSDTNVPTEVQKALDGALRGQ